MDILDLQLVTTALPQQHDFYTERISTAIVEQRSGVTESPAGRAAGPSDRVRYGSECDIGAKSVNAQRIGVDLLVVCCRVCVLQLSAHTGVRQLLGYALHDDRLIRMFGTHHTAGIRREIARLA
jgi:hypothetical protein